MQPHTVLVISKNLGRFTMDLGRLKITSYLMRVETICDNKIKEIDIAHGDNIC